VTEKEQKVSPKFKVKFVSHNIPSQPRLAELKHWCSEFQRLQLAPLCPGGSYGNLSFRETEGSNNFIITASALALKTDLSDDCFVQVTDVNLNDQVVQAHGNKAPSSESLLHFMIYGQRKDINAIFHGHSKEILDSGNTLNIPATEQEKPYGSLALVDSALPLAHKHDFFILKNHGFISLGKNMEEAGQNALSALRRCQSIK